jgi:hypothetical protein
MRHLRRTVLITRALGMIAMAPPAYAQLDLTGTWLSPQYYLSTEICVWDVVQSGTDLQIAQSCPGLGADFVASGAIDLPTGSFTASGGCGFGMPAGSGFDISGTVSADGLTINGTFFCAAFPGSILYTATRCGNGTLDQGEDCEPPAACCDGCHFASATACQAEPCVTGTCNAGVCEPGPPEPAETSCAIDGDNCTIEECDGGGACVVSEVVPCNSACAFCDETHTCIGDARNLGLAPTASPDGCWRPLDNNSRALFRNRTPNALMWSLSRETQTTLADFGDPTTSTGYQLCAFQRADYSDDWTLLTAARAEAGGNWKTTSRGFRFFDPNAVGGLSKLRLIAGSAPGNTRITLAGKGPLLDLPADFTALNFGVQGQVQVEVRADNGQCWGAHFTTEYGFRVRESVMRGSKGG